MNVLQSPDVQEIGGAGKIVEIDELNLRIVNIKEEHRVD